MQRAENITNKKISITNDKIIYSKETNIDYTKDWTEQKKVVEDPNLIPIIDNIENSDRCTNSKDIRKEISQKSKGENKIKFTYKLPLGGVALYFQDLDQKKKFQERDSKAIFGHTSVAHNPSKTTISIEIVGFIKNVPLNVDVGTLKKGIESQTRGSISKIHRLQYWDTKRPMKIVKVIFDSPDDFNRAFNVEIANVLPEQSKTIKIEKRRKLKFVRCFNCQRIGHSANQCQ